MCSSSPLITRPYLFNRLSWFFWKPAPLSLSLVCDRSWSWICVSLRSLHPIHHIVASSSRLPQSVFIVASLQHMVPPHIERLNTPLRFFQLLQPAPTRFVISVSIPPSSSILRLFETSNSFQFIPLYLYGLGSRIHCSLCSKAKSVNLVFGKLTLTPPPSLSDSFSNAIRVSRF